MLFICSTQYRTVVYFANGTTGGVHFAVCTKLAVLFSNCTISGSVYNIYLPKTKVLLREVYLLAYIVNISIEC